MRASRLSIWPTLPPRSYIARPQASLPYPLAEPECRIFARARQALFHGLHALGLGPGDEVLAPAYHHGSEIEALIQAGLTPRFYDSMDNLEPDEAQLESMIGPQVRALHLTHFLGFPQDALRWRRWCDERGLLLFEDAAQAWLSTRSGVASGSVGDLAIYCLYKTVGVPEGAALVGTAPPDAPAPDERWGIAELVRRNGAWFAERTSVANMLTRPLQRRQTVEAETEIGLGDVDAGVWRAVPPLIARLCEPGIAARRRANYLVLLDALRELVPSAFADVPDGASPFAFPIEVDDKSRMLERLARHGVGAFDFWSIPHPTLAVGEFPDAGRRRARTLALPVHQELRPHDLERIAAVVRGGKRRVARNRVEPSANIDGLADELTGLAERAGNIFATHEWLSTWWHHFGRGEQRVLAFRGGSGEPVAVAPLYAYRLAGLRVLRFIGHGPADELGPVCDPRSRAIVAGDLMHALAAGAAGAWDVLVAEQHPQEQGWSALLGGRPVRHESSPVLRVRGRSFEEIIASRSANFRQQVRRRERKLVRETGLRYRLANDPDTLEKDLGLLFDLHHMRWGADGSTAFDASRRAFHRDFAALALARGWCRLWIAEAGDQPVAALYGFRFAGRELYYQSGRDPAWDHYAVGFVLLSHAIRSAVEDGVSAYHLLRGDEPYKRRFANDDPGLETFVTASGSAGAAAAALAASAAEHPLPRHWLGRLARG
jgi:dTDP-4-amino-4,6-dideoxygalactose transaminase/CelD/BcsL family acetyltransferase involved in cellulose biosynthesis